jgi:nitrogen regulatory protein PII
MKLTFLAYREILDDRVSKALDELGIDYYTEWEEVKGKGHKTDAHLGNRPFPGYNNVRMIAFNDEDLLEKLIVKINELNTIVEKDDDKIRLFQVPLERIV